MAESRNKSYPTTIKHAGDKQASLDRIVYPHHTVSSRTKWRHSSGPSTYKPVSAGDFSYETTLNGGFVLKVYKASITQLNVEAIVNAANEDMDNAGGVAKDISDGAGQAMEKECSSYVNAHGSLKVGQNIVTTAGALPYQAVIHAVGPLWKNYRDKVACLDDLYDCIYNIMHRCKKNRYRSVAMTAISAGAFAVPKELCADTYVFAAANYSSIRLSSDCPKELHIVDIDNSVLRLVEESVKRWKKDPGSLNHKVTLPIFLKDNPKLAVYSDSTGNGQYETENRKDPLHLTTDIQKLKDEIFSWGGVATQYMFDGQLLVKIYQGDIFKVKHMDAIVCGVGKDLEPRGKIAENIRKYGGQSYLKSYQQMIDQHKNGPHVQYSDVYKCDGGRLEAKQVLHAVLKRVVEADSKETKAYQECMASILATIKENRCEKFTMSMIGTGTITTNKKKLIQCGKALLKAFDDFIVINGVKTGIKEIHLVNYSHEVNIAMVEIFDVASNQQTFAGKEIPKRHPDETSGNLKHRGYFRRQFTRGRGSYCKGRNSFCHGGRNDRRVHSSEDNRTLSSVGTTFGFPKSEATERCSCTHAWENVADNHRDVRQTRDVVQDEEYDKTHIDSDEDDDDTHMANNTKRFEGNLNIIDG